MIRALRLVEMAGFGFTQRRKEKTRRKALM